MTLLDQTVAHSSLGEPLTGFYHPHLAASGAPCRSLANPVRARQRGSGGRRPEDDFVCHSQLLSSPFSRPGATGLAEEAG